MFLTPTAIQSLYVHIPFCHSLCPFCSFSVRKDRPTLHLSYLKSVLEELSLRQIQIGKEAFHLNSIFIGGGTPSLLNLKEVHFLISGILDLIPSQTKLEITMEFNPEDISNSYIQALMELGVNRFSIGGQSFQDATLQQLGRNHSSQQLHSALKTMKEAGVSNLNLDLMFGIPEQSMESFEADLQRILDYEPDHLSLYGLEISEGTPFGKRYKESDSINLELLEQMYVTGIRFLEEHGWKQYEVSNFARSHKQSQSNLWVWNGGAYLGVGVGAHSYLPPYRWNNCNSIRKYTDSIQKQHFPVDFKEELTPLQNATEGLMLGLRQSSGLNLTQWKKDFHVQWTAKQENLVKYLCESEKMNVSLKSDSENKWEQISLTPQGFLLADAITTELIPETLL